MARLPNRSYSKDFKKELLKEFAASEKHPKAFAAEKGIPLQTFYYWRNNPKSPTGVKKTTKKSFAPISVKTP